MGEEKLLEVVVVRGHGAGQLWANEILGQTRRERRSDANSLLNDFGEFCGVSGGKDETLRRFGMLLAIGFPGVNANSGVGIGNVAVAIPNGVHFLKSFLVSRAVTPDFLADIFDTVAAEVEETRKIVGIAHIHGV